MSRLFKSRSFLVAGMVALSCVSAAVAHAGSNASLIEAAKSEGKMSYYTTMTLSQSKKVVDAFQKKYPFITPERWLADFDKLDIKPEVRPLILKENAARLLGL